MEEHIFGTYATDELKLVHHRAMRRGVQHWHDLSPRDPLPGQPVTVTIRTGPDVRVDHAACIYTTDGSAPAGSRGVPTTGEAVPFRRVETVWDSLVWDYLTVWQAVIPPQPDGVTVRYLISAWADAVNGAAVHGVHEVYADWPDAQRTAEEAAAAFFNKTAPPTTPPGDPGVPRHFAYHVDVYTPPDWVRDAVIYQIFVDRFAPTPGQDWAQTDDLTDFYGGTLWGVRDKLDYVAALGADVIWLSPIFPSPTAHGYDATDYKRVAPYLGGDEALGALVTAAHERGIRVILDLVCNHISHLHPIFQEALADPRSPYREWFTFGDSFPAGYRSFFGVAQMPQLDLNHPGARAWMLDIAQYWVRAFDIDGYRLDYALGPGPDFWAAFSAAVKAVKPEAFNFGEIVETPATLQAYIGRLDGALDFAIETALRKTYAFGTWTEAQFERFVADHYAFFPETFVMPTFLDNHDTTRFLYAAEGDKTKLRRAAEVQMQLPGPPIIYYGTEVGLSQRRSSHNGLEASREPMLWGADQDTELLAFYQDLIRARRREFEF